MTIQIKPGAVIVGSNEVNAIISGVHRIHAEHNPPYDVVITAGVDGNHTLAPRKSRHYTLEALDFSFRHIREDHREPMWGKIRGILGDKDYDFVKHTTHWHIEYDPK